MKKYKKTKKLYSRKYRKKNAKKVRAYNRKNSDKISSRAKARRKVAKKVGKSKIKGKEIHHKDGNPKNNSSKNLKIVKKHHGGGVKGNKNRKGK